MSHHDPLFDSDNSYEEDGMSNHFDDYQYDYHDAFYGEDSASYHPDADHEVESQFDEDGDEFDDYYDESMDGDHDSAMDSIGWGDDNSLAYGGGADDYGDW